MQLIVNADDFGLTRGVNQGILDCFLAGSVTSATLMVNMPATGDAVSIAEANPGLGVGLHFNLTLLEPVSNAKGLPLDAQGQFLPRSACEKAILMRRVTRAAIAEEFAAQLARFRTFGIPLSHVDSHQHIHMMPAVYDVLAEACRREGIPLRMPWVWSGRAHKQPLRRLVRSMLLRALVTRNHLRWRTGLARNAGFGSLFDLVSGPEQIDLAAYRELLSQVTSSGQPFELMVHPAIVDEQLRGFTRITDYSRAEHAVLSGEGFRQLTADLGFELVSYRQAKLT